MIVSDSGVAHCFESGHGQTLLGRRRMANIIASLVSAAGLVYFLNDEGVMRVVRPGSDFSLVAKMSLAKKPLPRRPQPGPDVPARGEEPLSVLALLLSR